MMQTRTRCWRAPRRVRKGANKGARVPFARAGLSVLMLLRLRV